MNHLCESCVYCILINENKQEKKTYCEIFNEIYGNITKCRHLSFGEKQDEI